MCWCKPNEDWASTLHPKEFLPQKGWDSRIPCFVWRSFFFGGSSGHRTFRFVQFVPFFFCESNVHSWNLVYVSFCCLEHTQIVWCFIFKDGTCTFDSWISIPPTKNQPPVIWGPNQTNPTKLGMLLRAAPAGSSDSWVRWPWAKDAEQKREASSGQWRLEPPLTFAGDPGDPAHPCDLWAGFQYHFFYMGCYVPRVRIAKRKVVSFHFLKSTSFLMGYYFKPAWIHQYSDPADASKTLNLELIRMRDIRCQGGRGTIFCILATLW